MRVTLHVHNVMLTIHIVAVQSSRGVLQLNKIIAIGIASVHLVISFCPASLRGNIHNQHYLQHQTLPYQDRPFKPWQDLKTLKCRTAS